MTVKTLTITEEAYNSLSVLKQQNESFSQLFLRLSKGKSNIAARFFGLAKISEKELEEWRMSYKKNRQLDANISEEKLVKREKRMKELGV